MGGPRLQALGLRPVVDARELLVMGFTEILAHLPRIFQALRQVDESAQEKKPDIAILIDYPDFHFRLARRLRRQNIPLVYYIPPKVWAWRKRRVKFLQEMFAGILCILPFEKEFYRKRNIPAVYVGNPLTDELPLSLTRSEARSKLQLSAAGPVLVLMPGSRPSELKRHLLLMLDAALQAAEELKKRSGHQMAGEGFPAQVTHAFEKLTVLIPFPVTTEHSVWNRRIQEWTQSLAQRASLLDIRITQGNAHECLVAADAGLIKSGTSTLEAALLGCPHAVVYKPSAVSAWIFRHLVRYRGPVGLVNLVANWRDLDGGKQDFLAPEILCEDVTVPALKAAILDLFLNLDSRTKMQRGFEKLRREMLEGSKDGNPSQRAAQEVLRIFKQSRMKEG